MVSRTEVLRRAATVWPTGTVPYSMSAIHGPDGYRQDCSGFVSLCWGIPLDAVGSGGGFNTATLLSYGWMYEIPIEALEPGDAIGLCGEQTLGAAGHIQLFEGFARKGFEGSARKGLAIWEQAGGVVGPRRRVIGGVPPGYRAYRFRDIVEDDAAEERDMVLLEIARDRSGIMWISTDRIVRRPLLDDEDVRYYLQRGATVPDQPEIAANGAPCVASIDRFGVDVSPVDDPRPRLVLDEQELGAIRTDAFKKVLVGNAPVDDAAVDIIDE